VVTHTPTIYPANDIQSDGRPRSIRCYGSYSNDLFLLANKQLCSRLPMMRRPTDRARAWCYQTPPKFNSMFGPPLHRRGASPCRSLCAHPHLRAYRMCSNRPLSSRMTLPVKVGYLGYFSRVTEIHGHNGQIPKVGYLGYFSRVTEIHGHNGQIPKVG